METKEIWKDIPSYEGLYQVSNLGNVKSIGYGKERYLRLRLSKSGYYRVNLSKDKISTTKPVHQLVSEAFLGHNPCGMKLVINHINFNKKDNRVENLEIVTQRENGNKKHLKSTSKYVGVYWYKPLNKWRAQITLNGKNNYIGLFEKEIDASQAYQDRLKEIEDING